MHTRRMMVGRTSLLAAGLSFALGLSAQAPEPGQRDMGQMMQMLNQGMMGGGMMGPGMMNMMGQGMGMMTTGGPGPTMILRMGDALNLTEEQRTQLEAIQTEYSDSVQGLMNRAMEAHQNAAAALEGDSPDFDAYEEALREGADQMVEAHVAMARVAAEAREVLTDVTISLSSCRVACK